MADDVVIGSASVQITGDYSGLEKSFTESQQLAQQAGQAIGAALETGASGANSLTAAMDTGTAATAAFESQLQSLVAQGMTAAEALQAVTGQTLEEATAASTAAAAAEKLAADSSQAATGVAQVGQAAQQATPPLQDAALASNSLMESFAGFAAAAIAAAGIQQIGEASIFAYGHLQQLTTSLDLLGAGAKGAAAEVQNLKALSVQLAVPFENLAHQAQGLAAQFGTGEGVTAVLIAAGNASAGAGKSFDAASAAIERIGVTGAVSARQLFALGLNWQDMAEAMGTSIADAQEKLKKGGQDAQQDVADVIDAINAKFGDAAERQAQNTIGQWTNLKNQAEFLFQQIGESLSGIVEVMAGAMKVVASGLVSVVGGTQLVTVAVIGMVRQGIEAIKGLGQVAFETMKGNFAAAAFAAADAYQKIKTAGEYTDQSLEDHARKTAAQLEAIWSDSAKKISATFTPTGGGGNDGVLKATRDKVKGFSDQTGALAVLIEMEKLELATQRDVTVETAKFNEQFGTLISQSEMVAIKTAAITLAFDNFKTSMPDPGDTKFFQNLAVEIDKSDRLVKKITSDMADLAKEGISGTPEAQMADALDKLGIGFDSLTLKTRAAKTAAAEYIAANSADMSKVSVAWENLNSELGRLAKVNLPEAINVQEELIASMERMNAPMLQIIAAQEKELQLEIQLKTERGEAANSQIIALANMRAGTAALSTLNNTLANTYVSIFHTIDQGFGELGGAIAQIINGAGSFYKAWHAAMNQIEVQLVSTLITAVIKYGVAWVTAHVLGTAASTAHATAETAAITATSAARAVATTAQLAQIVAVTAAQTASIATITAAQLASFVTIKVASTALDVSEVLGEAAVGGAAAAASTAAIPIIGPALALEAGAAMYASIAGIYAPLATFSEGGMVPQDMIAMVHKGEYVLPAEKTAQAMLGGGSGAIQVHFDFSGAHFSNGLNDTQVKTVFDRAFRMSKLAGALPAGRFPQ